MAGGIRNRLWKLLEALIAWLKVLHVMTLLVWAGTLFYLPGLITAHCRVENRQAFYRVRTITRRTYIVVASPAAILTILTGSLLVPFTGADGGWLALKLTAVGLMVVFHVACGAMITALGRNPKAYDLDHFDWLAIVPAVLVPVVLWLVMGKPL